MKKYFSKAFALHLVKCWKHVMFATGIMVAWFSYLNWGLY